jgi:Zn-dependent peptidase ImmA (M78 family)
VGLIDFGTIAARAALVRHKAGLIGKDPPYHTHDIMEAAFPDVAVVGADNLPHFVIEMVEATPKRRVVFYNRKVSTSTQRVGIMHGCHHLLTDLKGVAEPVKRECNLNLRGLERSGVIAADAIEVACDIFAGEILVPFDVLDAYAPERLYPKSNPELQAFDEECDRIASRFQVPVGFARYRLWDLMHLRRTNMFVKGA